MATNDLELADRLATVAEMINDPAVGPDSADLETFIQRFKSDTEFVKLAELSRRLKRSLPAPAPAEPAVVGR